MRLFDAGVQEKLCGKIGGRSKLAKYVYPSEKHEWYDVLRGVVQGAPESPWLTLATI